MKKLIVNPENPNGLSVDLTAEEIEQMNTDIANGQAEEQARADKEQQAELDAQAKATAQASGNQKLLDLGLSQAEATALTGYTPPSEE